MYMLTLPRQLQHNCSNPLLKRCLIKTAKTCLLMCALQRQLQQTRATPVSNCWWKPISMRCNNHVVQHMHYCGNLWIAKTTTTKILECYSCFLSYTTNYRFWRWGLSLILWSLSVSFSLRAEIPNARILSYLNIKKYISMLFYLS